MIIRIISDHGVREDYLDQQREIRRKAMQCFGSMKLGYSFSTNHKKLCIHRREYNIHANEEENNFDIKGDRLDPFLVSSR